MWALPVIGNLGVAFWAWPKTTQQAWQLSARALVENTKKTGYGRLALLLNYCKCWDTTDIMVDHHHNQRQNLSKWKPLDKSNWRHKWARYFQRLNFVKWSPLAKLTEWLVVAFRLNFLWLTVCSCRFIGTVRVGVEKTLLTFAGLNTRKYFTFSDLQVLGYLKSRYYKRTHFRHSRNFILSKNLGISEVYCWHTVQ